MQSAGGGSCSFCRLTQMGFLRLATNRKAFPNDALPMNEAWRIYELMLSDQRVVFTDEPAGIEFAWRALTQDQTFSTHVWNDAYLAAFARTAELEVVTFDKGFAKFKDLRFTLLS